VVLVILVDKVEQDRAAFKQPDGLVTELVRDGGDLISARLLAETLTACVTVT
jgi:hypothetical protein